MKKVLLILLMLLPFFVSAEEVTLTNCVDGDTLKALLNEKQITIRLLAIDTPESVHPTIGEEEYGKEASNYTCNLLKNAKKIEIEYDNNSDKEDKYGRVLAWVFVDGKLLQSEIIKKGYGEVAYIYGEYKYTDLLKRQENLAKLNNIGMWSKDYNQTEYIIIFIIIILIIFLIVYIYFKNELKKRHKKSKIRLRV